MQRSSEIYKILKGIQNIWVEYPDLRLGQLIANVIKEEKELYYIRDEDLIDKMIQFYKNIDKYYTRNKK